jgi:uncharacterized protein (TIGR02678 family)
MTAPFLAEALAQHAADEREQALKALLDRPLQTAADPDFPLVRKHAGALRDWFGREAGWSLHVEREFARLYKRPADRGDATRGAPGFDRRHYVLLCLILAVLERSEPQITLGRLGERTLEAAAEPELAETGFTFTLERQVERRELVRVCRLLLHLGVLARVSGDEESFVHQSGDALYDIHRRALGALLATERGPSSLPAEVTDLNSRLAMLAEEFVADSAEGRRTAIRHDLTRRLLDDPVVYFDELSDAARAYFSGQRGPIGARLREATGLSPESRAEGMALVDPDGEATDVKLPAEGTDAHATLLAAEWLGDRERRAPGETVGEDEVASWLRDAARAYRKYWRKATREPGAERELARRVLERLTALKLIRREAGRVAARPALLRYAIGQAATTQGELL